MTATPESPTGAALLEREAAVARIADAFAAARSGHGGAVMFVAEPGLGKTTVLTEARRRATGFAVASAGCSEVEGSIPFGILDNLLNTVGAPVTVGPVAEDPVDARLSRFRAVIDWLRNEAPSPLLLAVDDLHWSDPDSLELLAMVCRRLSGHAVVVVATMRPWPPEARHHAQLLAHDHFAVVSELPPLSDAASAALLEERLGSRPDDQAVGRARQACAGNPLFLVEVADSWRRGEDALEGSVGSLAERLLLPRFAGVGSEGLRWARAASVLGTRFEPSLVAPLAGQDDATALGAIERLCTAGLVRGAGEGLVEFVHPLFRQVLYEDMAPPVRGALHTQAFRALSDRGAEPAEAAPHAVAAQLAGDDRAVATLRAAGREALVAGAVATAAGHFEAALRLGGTRCTRDLLLDLARARLWTGRVDLAEASVRRFLAGDGLGDLERVEGLRLLAQILLAATRTEAAKAAWEEAAEVAGPVDADVAAELLLDATFMGWLFEGPRLARATTRRVLDMVPATGAGTSDLRLRALTADSYLALLGGDPSGLDVLAGAARRELHRPDPVPLSAWTWDVVWGYANLAKVVERWEDNLAMYRVWSDAAERRGASLTVQAMAVNQADALWRIGRLSEATALLEGAANFAELAPMLAPFVSVGMAHLSYELGDDASGASWAARVERFLEVMGESAYLRLWLLLFTCRGNLRAGRHLEALAAARRAAEVADRSGILEPCVVPWHAAAIEACTAAGAVDEVEALTRSLDERCEPLPCKMPRAVAAVGHASVAWQRGDLESADAWFHEALAHNAAAPMPLFQAETLVTYGRFLRHSRRARDARATLHRALDLVEPIGAARIGAVAAEELAVAGGRRHQGRGSPSRDLTPQERRVAGLAATGLTNSEIAGRLFVAPKTVDHHLTSIYAKLRIRSRRELMLSWRPEDEDGTGTEGGVTAEESAH